jgi:hypothetical protein
MLAGPSDLVDKLSSKIGASSDCSNFATLPKLGFKIGNKVLNLDPEDYMDKGNGGCDFSLMALDVPPPKGPLFIFGDPFLRRFVTIYDKNGPRVGFAVAKHGSMDGMMANQIIANVGGDAQAGQSTGSAEYSYNPKQQTLSLDSGMMMGDPASDDSSPTPDHNTVVAEARADVAASDATDTATTTTAVAPASSDSTPATDSWASAANAANAAATADATPSATPASSGSNDIINQFASSWEKTSADITSTTTTMANPFMNNWDGSSPSSTTTAIDKFQFSWDKPSTPSADTSVSTPASDASNSLSSWEKAFESPKPATQAAAPEDYVKKYELGSESAPSGTTKDGVLAEMNKLLGRTTSPSDGMWIQQHAVGHKGRTHRLVSIKLHKSK